jgi:hypothetical protein
VPDFSRLDLSTATYSGRWGKRGKFQKFRVWTPTNPAGGGNVSGYLAPPWRAVFFKHGGGKMNPDDLDLNTNSTALYLANTLGCAVISYDTTPGGYYVEEAQEPEMKVWPETHEEDAAFIAWIRTHAEDEDIWGAGGSISTDPVKSLHWGSSSGAWDVIKTQLARDGEYDYASGGLQSSDAAFARKFGHTCAHVLANQQQAILSTFVKSKVAAVDPVDSYRVNGAHSIGATTIAINTGSGAFLKGNRILIDGDSDQYAVNGDLDGAGNLPIFPALRINLAGGETIERQTTTMDTYGDFGWCGGYFFPQGEGWVWQADIETDANLVEFPWERKRAADADLQLTADNPRVKQANWLFIGSASSNPLLTTALTGELSFRNILPGVHGLAADGDIHPAHNDLHNEAQAFAVAYIIDALGNTTNVAVYAGNATSNVNVGETNWNKGRNADFSTTILGTFLTTRGF